MGAHEVLKHLGRLAAMAGCVLLLGTTAAAQTADTEPAPAAGRDQQPPAATAVGEPETAAARPDGEGAAAAPRDAEPPAPERARPLADRLTYEREYFMYQASGRRDPFMPLLTGAFGPRFEELELRGIIFSRTPGASVALLADPDGVIYRARRGEMVGNARVVEISPDHVRFAVDNYGIVRSERLDLKIKDEKRGP